MIVEWITEHSHEVPEIKMKRENKLKRDIHISKITIKMSLD